MKNLILLILIAVALSKQHFPNIRTNSPPFTKQQHAIYNPQIMSPLVTHRIVYYYQGRIDIQINSGQLQIIDFWLSITNATKNCLNQKCFIGWIHKIMINNTVHMNWDQISETDKKPVFTFDTTTAVNYTIKFSNSLDFITKEIIKLACQDFNPFKLHHDSSPLLSAPQVHDDHNLITLTSPIHIDGLEPSPSLFTQKTTFNPDHLLNTREDTFNIQLLTSPTQHPTKIPQLNAIIHFKLTFLTKNNILKTEIISKQTMFLNFKNITSKTYKQIAHQTDSSIKFNQQFDNQPTIQLFQNSHFPGQQKDLLLHHYFQEQNLKPSNIQVVSQASPSNPNSHRLLQSYSVLNYHKILYQKTVLSRKISLGINAICQLNTNSYTITCTSNLLYTLFGSQKTITIFSYTRSLDSAWDWNKVYQGNWGFSISVPIILPIKLITINFHINIHYYINLSLHAKWISKSPLQYQMKALVETGVDTNVRASLKVVVIEGGVYIKGTLIKVGTDPTFTITFNLPQRKLYTHLTWYYWIIAFNFEWGFFYRTIRIQLKRILRLRFRKIITWGPYKDVGKWKISGIYQKFKILDHNQVRNI